MMVEDNVEGNSRPRGATDEQNRFISNADAEHSGAGDILDEVRSSSLSDLEDGADELEMVSANSVLSRPIEVDSEAETERLENSPNKVRNHKEVEVNGLIFTKSPSKLAQSVVPNTEVQENSSDSVVSSPNPSDDDLDSEIPSEPSMVSDNEDKVDGHGRDILSKKRKHHELEDDSASDDGAQDSRRRRIRTQSVISDAEEQPQPALSREATMDSTGDAPSNQDPPDSTSAGHQNVQPVLNSKGLKAAKRKHSKGRGQENLKNIVEEGEAPDRVPEPGADDVPPASDDERPQGEDEDVEAAARDEEECKSLLPRK